MNGAMALVSEDAYRAVRAEIERLREEHRAQACAVHVLLKDNALLLKENERLRAEILACGGHPLRDTTTGDALQASSGFCG